MNEFAVSHIYMQELESEYVKVVIEQHQKSTEEKDQEIVWFKEGKISIL